MNEQLDAAIEGNLAGQAGVVGGLIAFGVVGLFIGPVTLAVTYTLRESWVCEGAAGTE